MGQQSRRRFLASISAASVAAGLSIPALARLRPHRDQEIGVGVAGLRGRGGQLTDWFRRTKGARIVALCDPDQSVLDRASASCAERNEQIAAYRDIRAMLDDDKVDVVVVATPNHWHSLMAIWACQAGKDVYVEKPVSHNMWEGAQLTAAASKYNRIVQAGMQSRSSTCIPEAAAWLHEGHLGKMMLARGLCYKPRQSIGRVEGPQTAPSHIDYDLWTGPAPLKPLARKRLHYDWHWDFDTGNGDLGNQGVHQMDVCRWVAGHQDLPRRAWSCGGRLGYEDDGNTPNTQVILLDYEDVPIIFEVRGLPSDAQFQREGWGQNMDNYLGRSIGVIIHCEGGTARINQTPNAVTIHDNQGKEVKRFVGGGDHVANFISAVQSRNHNDLSCPVREGVVSADLCHLGQISYQLGRPGPLPNLTDNTDNHFSADSLDRLTQHLSANGVDLSTSPLQIGEPLTIDDGLVIDNPKATAMHTRQYRSPYSVPDLTS